MPTHRERALMDVLEDERLNAIKRILDPASDRSPDPVGFIDHANLSKLYEYVRSSSAHKVITELTGAEIAELHKQMGRIETRRKIFRFSRLYPESFSFSRTLK